MAVATATILCAGKTIPSSYRLLSVDVQTEVNRIPKAEIRLLDGNALNQYAVSDSADFEPGAKVEIKLRYEGGQDVSVFEGIVVKQTLEWVQRSAVLVVRAKDVAVKLTMRRKSAVHVEKTDDVIIKELIDKVVQPGDIPATTVRHPAMVQFDCTAWDFICMRAEAIGMLVVVDAGKLSLYPMDEPSDKKHPLTWGNKMFDFEVEAAAEHPYGSVQSVAWDAAQNSLSKAPSEATKAPKIPGNLDPDAIAKSLDRDVCTLKHPVPLVDGELKAWANGRLARSVLSMLRGRVSIPGNASIKLRDQLDLTGVGKRFSGTAMVSAIRHRYDPAGFRTELQFGLDPERYCQKENISEVPAGGLLPAVRGLQIGVVAAFEPDPESIARVKVILPGVDEKPASAVWARIARLDSGADHGVFFHPEEGDEVIVGFLFDDPRYPVVLGSLFGSKNAVPKEFAAPDANNLEKGVFSRGGTTIKFIDAKEPSLVIKTKAGNSITIDGPGKSVALADQHGHKIIMDANGITIDAASGQVTIKGSKVDVQ